MLPAMTNQTGVYTHRMSLTPPPPLCATKNLKICPKSAWYWMPCFIDKLSQSSPISLTIMSSLYMTTNYPIYTAWFTSSDLTSDLKNRLNEVSLLFWCRWCFSNTSWNFHLTDINNKRIGNLVFLDHYFAGGYFTDYFHKKRKEINKIGRLDSVAVHFDYPICSSLLMPCKSNNIFRTWPCVAMAIRYPSTSSRDESSLHHS